MPYKDKQKKAEYTQQYYVKNRKELLLYAEKYRLTHKQQINEKMKIYGQIKSEQIKKYRLKNRSTILSKLKLSGLKLRHKVIHAYGGLCTCCGENELTFLTIDHINGGGNAERAKIGGGSQFYRWLVKNHFPQNGYQVLCFNCNHSKHRLGVCQHKLSEEEVWAKSSHKS